MIAYCSDHGDYAELYDLENDTKELRNIATDEVNQPIITAMYQRL